MRSSGAAPSTSWRESLINSDPARVRCGFTRRAERRVVASR
jgi:hypothetical protein